MPSTQLEAWLAEDAADEDLTSTTVIPEGAEGRGEIVAKQAAVVAGLAPARQVLERLDAEVTCPAAPGDRVEPGDVLVEATGPARALLAAERIALNVLAHLSGIATRTAQVVDRVEEIGADCQVLATRKTTPGLREHEHAAVEAGGGHPHRADLAEAILVKENHLAFLTIEEAVEAARRNAPEAFCMVEAESLDEARAVARSGADGVLLDNLDPSGLEDTVELVRRIQPGIVVEASGGITADTVGDYAPHVDRVSLGSVTHSAPSVDVSMRIQPA